MMNAPSGDVDGSPTSGTNSGGVSGRSTVRRHLQTVRSHWVLCLVAILLTSVGSIVANRLRPPSYEATAQLLVTPAPRDDPNLLGLPVIRDSGDPIRTIATAAVVLRSGEAAAAAAARLGRPWSPDRVLQAIDMAPLGQSDVVTIKAKAASPGVALVVANLYATSLLEVRRDRFAQVVDQAISDTATQAGRSNTQGSLGTRLDYLQAIRRTGDPSVSLSELAALPTTPTGPSAWLIVIVAIVLGIALADTAVIVAERLEWRKMPPANVPTPPRSDSTARFGDGRDAPGDSDFGVAPEDAEAASRAIASP
jgi:capsular polysaccharide biosynthesis protein